MRTPHCRANLTPSFPILVSCLLWAIIHGNSLAAGLGGQGNSQIQVSELFRVGDEAAGDTVLFGSIGGLAVNSAGQIFVGDRQSMNVRVFSADGDQIGKFGSSGEGPGELGDIAGVYVGSSDSMYVYDFRRRTLSRFDPDTWGFNESFRIERHDSLGSPYDVIGISDAGPIALYAPGISTSNAEQDRYAVAAQTDWEGAVVRSLARGLPHMELRIFADNPGRVGVRAVPFGRSSFFRYSPGGRLYSGWNESIDLLVTSLEGEVVGRLVRDHAPVRVTGAERDAIVQPEHFDSIHRFKPAFRAMAVDDRGQVWLKGMEQEEGGTAEWLVLDRAGEVAGRVMLPGNVTLIVIRLGSGRAYGYTSGDEEAPMLVVYSVDM